MKWWMKWNRASQTALNISDDPFGLGFNNLLQSENKKKNQIIGFKTFQSSD